MKVTLNIPDGYEIDPVITNASEEMMKLALMITTESLHLMQKKSNPIELERLQSKMDDMSTIYTTFFSKSYEDSKLKLHEATDKIIELEKLLAVSKSERELEAARIIQSSKYELKALEDHLNHKNSNLQRDSTVEAQKLLDKLQQQELEFQTYKGTNSLQNEVKTLSCMTQKTQKHDEKVEVLLQEISTGKTHYIDLKETYDNEKRQLVEKITDLEGKCYISSKKGQHGEIIIKELIEDFGLNATPTPYEKDAGDLRVTQDDDSGFYTNDDNMRLKIECKKKGKITKQDLVDFEQSAIRAFENKQANQALFISLDYWIPGHPTSMIIKYVNDEFGRPILPIVFLGAIRKPFQPLCQEQIEIVLNMHLQMHFQLSKFKNIAVGTELQDEELVQVRSLFEQTVNYVEEMQKNFQDQDENILKLQSTHSNMRITMLKYYKSLQTINSNVPWLQQPMQIRHENLLNVVFAKGDKFDWNASLNGTQRNGLKKYFGEECVKTVHEHISKKSKT